MRRSISQPGLIGPQSVAGDPGPDTLDATERLLRLNIAARADFLEAETDLEEIRSQVARLAAGIHDTEDEARPVCADADGKVPRARNTGGRGPVIAVAMGLIGCIAGLAGTEVATGQAPQVAAIQAGAQSVTTVVPQDVAAGEFVHASREADTAATAATVVALPVRRTVVASTDDGAAMVPDQAAASRGSAVRTTASAGPASAGMAGGSASASDPNRDPGEAFYGSRFAKASASERACLARAIYFEARGEEFEGQVAVAQVVLNRARSVKWPSTICGVVNQGVERREKCQFSFACFAHAEPSGPLWEQAQSIAEEAVTGHAWLREALEATYYHATNVAPVWRLGLVATGTIGSHVFYRDGFGLRAAIGAKVRPIVKAHPALAFVGSSRSVTAVRTTVASISAPTAAKPHPKVSERQVSMQPVGQADGARKKAVKSDQADWSAHLFGGN